MNRETIIQMAREIGIQVAFDLKSEKQIACITYGSLERFAAAIRAETKEEDARICEKERVEESTLGEIADAQFNLALEFAAAAIRASK